MTFQVSVAPSGREFSCNEDETILSAAIKAGISLPYGCKNGACGSCKGKLISGQVEHGKHQEKALSEQEEAQGFALFCCAKPRSDVSIEAREVIVSSDYPIKKLPCRVAQLDKLSDDVMLLGLQLPANEVFNFRPGQYIEFMLKDGKRRSYSMANAPVVVGNSVANSVNSTEAGVAAPAEPAITLHIRHMPGGVFTDQVFGSLKLRDILRFEGPHGSFFLREDSDKPIILLASGTGFAPVKALVEQLIRLDSKRSVSLYWGGRRPQDLYMNSLCQQWGSQLASFKYIPVISNALDSDAWQGRTGFVHQAVLQDHPDLSLHQVYACGAPIVVDSARRDFVAVAQLPEDQFFADAFTSEADLQNS